MRRTPKQETQATIASWAKEHDNREPDLVMQGFLDAAKELEVVWYTGEYFDLPDKFGDALAELILAAAAIDLDVQDALNAAMVRRRKGRT